FSVWLISKAMTFLRLRPFQRRLIEAAYGLLDGKVPLKSDRLTVASMAIEGGRYRKVQTELARAYTCLREVCILIASNPQEFIPGETDPRLVPLAVLPLNGRLLSALKRSIRPQRNDRLLTLADLLALELDTPKGVDNLLSLSGIGPVSLSEINGALLSVGEAPLAGFESRKK
ncbi:MAG: hypothetical protein CEO22_67, partial [Candidatus Berkelbacteria bacterium Gr01-1014_85]